MTDFFPGFGALFAAGIESLIVFVVIAIFAAISSMLQKRQRDKQQGSRTSREETGSGDWPGESTAGSGSTAASNWEEELKRLLGQAPAEPPPPPPVIVVSRPPSPPPLVVVKRQTFPAPRHSAETHEDCPTLETAELVVTPPVLGRLEQSQAAMASASHLDDRVAMRLEQVTKHRVGQTHAVHRVTVSKDISDAVAMFRHPRTARQAFVVSQIFGAPRSLESSPW